MTKTHVLGFSHPGHRLASQNCVRTGRPVGTVYAGDAVLSVRIRFAETVQPGIITVSFVFVRPYGDPFAAIGTENLFEEDSLR